jgi:hypothetical protein
MPTTDLSDTLGSSRGSTQEIGSIDPKRFRNCSQSFEAGTKDRIVFKAPDSMCGHADPLCKSLLGKSQFQAKSAKF